MEKTEREYFLHEQMKAIQKELGDEEGKDELAEIEDKIKKTKLSKEAREKATHELKKLRQMSPMSAESTVMRNYLDWLLSIPWAKRSKIKKDLKLAQEILDNDHFGLEKVKERIVEYLAVRQRAATSCASRSAACTMRRRSAATGVPISAPCRARSSSRCARPKLRIRCSCSTRSTRWVRTSAATLLRRCSKCSTPSRTTPSTTNTSRSTT